MRNAAPRALWLYAKGRTVQIKKFIGISSPYEAPEKAELATKPAARI